MELVSVCEDHSPEVPLDNANGIGERKERELCLPAIIDSVSCVQAPVKYSGRSVNKEGPTLPLCHQDACAHYPKEPLNQNQICTFSTMTELANVCVLSGPNRGYVPFEPLCSPGLQQPAGPCTLTRPVFFDKVPRGIFWGY
jgi:hypothetical protein